MKLTKKYRLVWDIETLVLIFEYDIEYNKESITESHNKNIEGFDSDNLEEILKFMEKNELIQIENGNL